MIKVGPYLSAILFFLLSICFSVAVQAHGNAYSVHKSQGQKESEVTFKLVQGGVPAIPVTIEKEAKGLFVLATGSSNSFVTETFVRKYHLKVSKTTLGEVVKSDQIQIGSFQFNNGLYVLRGAAAEVWESSGINGILGTDLFEEMAIRTDLSNGKIHFLSPGNLTPDAVKAAGFGVAIDRPLMMRRDRRFMTLVSIESDGTSIDAMLNLYVNYVSLPQKDGPAGQSTGTIKKLSIGGVQLSNVPVYYNDQFTVDGVLHLGMVALSQCELLFDYPARKVYVLPAAPDNPAHVAIRQSSAGMQRLEVPLTVLIHGLPAIPLTHSNGVQGLFLLGTDNPNNYVTETFVKKSRSEVTQYQGIDIIKGTELRFGDQPVDMSEMGFRVLRGSDSTALDQLGISGSLGVNMLTPAAIRIDFDQQKCSILLPGNLSAEAVKAEGFGAALNHPLPVRQDDSGRMLVRIEYNGRAIDALLDLHTNSVRLPKKLAPATRSAAASGRLRLGNVTLPKVPIEFADDPSLKDVGSIGIDALSQCNLLLDYSAHKVYVLAASRNNPAYRANQSDSMAGPKPAKVILPFRPMPRHGAPVVTLEVNGKYKGNFVLDTGAEGCVVNRQFARRVGLLSDAVTPLWDGNGNPFIRIPTRFGSSTIDLPASVPNYPVLDLLASLGVDGIIGADFLKQFAIMFDFSRQQCVFLFPGNLSPDRVKTLGFGNAANKAITLRPVAGMNAVQVPVTVNRQALNLVLDTGANGINLPATINLPREGRIPIRLMTIQGISKHEGLPLREFVVGSLRFTRVWGNVATEKSSDNPLVLGMDILSRCDMLLDYGAKKLYLQPANNPRNASRLVNQQVNIRDMNIGRSSRDEWMVVSFSEKGPFTKAGLRVGDILIAINGQPIPREFGEIAGHALSENRRYQLTVLRGPSRKRLQLSISLPTESILPQLHTSP